MKMDWRIIKCACGRHDWGLPVDVMLGLFRKQCRFCGVTKLVPKYEVMRRAK